MDRGDYTLIWERVDMGSIPLARWTARLTVPYVSVTFAQVSWAELRGMWVLQVMPQGADGKRPTIWCAYRSKEKAMAHVERWARFHWRRVPVWQHPQERGHS